MWICHKDCSTVNWCQLYDVFTYLRVLLIDKDLCECQNISNKFPCALLFALFIPRSPFFGKGFLSHVVFIYSICSVFEIFLAKRMIIRISSLKIMLIFVNMFLLRRRKKRRILYHYQCWTLIFLMWMCRMVFIPSILPW